LFKDKIALAIEDTGDSPLDSKLKAVLPGVHQRLIANQREVLSLRTLVEDGFLTLGTKVAEAFECQEQAIKERDCKTGEAYLSLAQGLKQEGDSSPVRTFRREDVESNKNSEQELDTDTTTNRLMTRPHSLVMRHKSIHTIYYEWYGLETYVNTLVEGGIASLEEKHKSIWRAHFSPAEKQYFSRLQKVVKGRKEQSKCEAKEPCKILDNWDALFQGEAKSLVTKMATVVQEMGLIVTRKARGKQKQSNQPQTP
jgi:hypothetical protein